MTALRAFPASISHDLLPHLEWDGNAQGGSVKQQPPPLVQGQDCRSEMIHLQRSAVKNQRPVEMMGHMIGLGFVKLGFNG